MEKRYFHISYQWPPNCRGGKTVTVAVIDDGSSTSEMARVAISKLNKHLNENVTVLSYNKLPSNYKANDPNIIE